MASLQDTRPQQQIKDHPCVGVVYTLCKHLHWTSHPSHRARNVRCIDLAAIVLHEQQHVRIPRRYEATLTAQL
eukprot:6360342-Amphidinium_carterae.1